MKMRLSPIAIARMARQREAEEIGTYYDAAIDPNNMEDVVCRIFGHEWQTFTKDGASREVCRYCGKEKVHA